MVGAARIDGFRSLGAFVRSSNWLISACVVARLPAVMMVMNRSPGTDQLNILRKVEILSTPEFVRVSDMKAMPLSSNIPTQYVILEPTAPALFYDCYCSTRKDTTMLLSRAPNDMPEIGAASR